MEMTMEEYDREIGYRFVSLADIQEAVASSKGWHSGWGHRTLYPTHGSQRCYRGVTYRYLGNIYEPEDGVLYIDYDHIPLLMKFKDKYYKIHDGEITRTNIDHINSFIDKFGGFHITMKQWKQLPFYKPFAFMEDGKTIKQYEFEELDLPEAKEEEDDELPFF